MPDSNLEQLIRAAHLLRPLLDELVFVGGSVAGLLITDGASADPRPTLDVDAIAAIASYAEYVEFGDRLRALGFAEDHRDGAPTCRWVYEALILDIMPLDERILGFSNRWYRDAVETAVWRRLTDELEIRLLTAPLFLATKLEAFRDRGSRDFFGSRDLEDFIFVLDGRTTLAGELLAEKPELRAYIRSEVASLLAAPGFLDALPGFLPPDAASQSRVVSVLQRLKELASL